MTASGWTTEVIPFLKANLPRLEDGSGWDHMHATAFQIGCEALVALGQAKETPWGAVPRKPARLPRLLPRWDDICVAVLGLAEQQGKLSYRLPGGAMPKRRAGDCIVIKNGAHALPAPNIGAAFGLGPAHATPDVLLVLRALGLRTTTPWSAMAEPVLWRQNPTAWGLAFQTDPRFAGAVERTLQTLPSAMATQLTQLVQINDADLDAAIVAQSKAQARLQSRPDALAPVRPPISATSARQRLVVQRRHDLDWLFFRHWRLDDGWLTPASATRALTVFHDPLATAMRRAVIARLFPDLPDMAAG